MENSHQPAWKRIILSPRLVVLTALAVRLLYLVLYRNSPFFNVPVWDAADYHEIALALAGGTLPAEMVYRPPLYPLFLGTVYMVFGSGALMPRILQIVMGTVSCLLVKRIADRMFGTTAGTISGMAAALSGMMFYFDLELLPTCLFVFLLLLFMNELTSMTEKGASPSLAGLWLGLSALARPLVLPFFPVALFWVWLKTRSIRKVLQFSGLCAAPLVLSLIIHAAAGNGPVLVSAQGGVNLYIGSHPDSDGMTARFPGVGAGWGWETVRHWAESRAGRELTPHAIDGIFRHEAIQTLRSDYSGWMKRLTRKALLFWNRIEISNNRDLYYHAHKFPLFGVLMWIGFPLALPWAFCALAAYRNMPAARLLAAFIAIFFLTVIPFFVNARFRHPLTPFLLILASGGMLWMINTLRLKEFRRMIIPGIGFVAGLLLPWSIDSNIDVKRWDYGIYTEGIVYEKAGNKNLAMEKYKEALRVNPRAPFANFSLAELYREKGDLDSAVKHYRREVEVQPTYANAWNNLGVTLNELDEPDNALMCYEKALGYQSNLREAAANAARIWAQRGLDAAGRGEWLTAEQLAAKAVQLDPGNPLYRTLVVESRVNRGDTTYARRELGVILSLTPGFQPAEALLKSLQNDPGAGQ